MSSTGNELDQYNKFVELIDLKSIELGSLTCEQNSEFPHGGTPLDIAIDYDVKNAKQQGLEITFPFEFKCKAFYNRNDGETKIDLIPLKDTLFSIKFTFIIKYHLDLGEEMKSSDVLKDYEGIIEEFSEKVVIINTWPYVRELVSNLTGKMGIPPLMIPLKKAYQ